MIVAQAYQKVRDAVTLTDDQKKARDAVMKDTQALMTEARTKVMEILTDDQKEKLKAAMPQRGGRGGRGRGGDSRQSRRKRPRTGVAITMALLPFALRKPHLSRSERRHLLIRRSLAVLRRARMNIFAADHEEYDGAQAAALPQLSMRSLGELGVAAERELVTLYGYAADPAGDAVGGVFLEIGGVAYPACYGLDRNDETKAFGAARTAHNWFARRFSYRQLPPGEHRVTLMVLTKDCRARFVPKTVKVVIPPKAPP